MTNEEKDTLKGLLSVLPTAPRKNGVTKQSAKHAFRLVDAFTDETAIPEIATFYGAIQFEWSWSPGMRLTLLISTGGVTGSWEKVEKIPFERDIHPSKGGDVHDFPVIADFVHNSLKTRRDNA